eukprot:m.910360 g.910360  ORF g.910360 m.910360 type:complete len:354 (-) comp60109_c0_seq28:4369-5430(-)
MRQPARRENERARDGAHRTLSPSNTITATEQHAPARLVTSTSLTLGQYLAQDAICKRRSVDCVDIQHFSESSLGKELRFEPVLAVHPAFLKLLPVKCIVTRAGLLQAFATDMRTTRAQQQGLSDRLFAVLRAEVGARRAQAQAAPQHERVLETFSLRNCSINCSEFCNRDGSFEITSIICLDGRSLALLHAEPPFHEALVQFASSQPLFCPPVQLAHSLSAAQMGFSNLAHGLHIGDVAAPNLFEWKHREQFEFWLAAEDCLRDSKSLSSDDWIIHAASFVSDVLICRVFSATSALAVDTAVQVLQEHSSSIDEIPMGRFPKEFQRIFWNWQTLCDLRLDRRHWPPCSSVPPS